MTRAEHYAEAARFITESREALDQGLSELRLAKCDVECAARALDQDLDELLKCTCSDCGEPVPCKCAWMQERAA